MKKALTALKMSTVGPILDYWLRVNYVNKFYIINFFIVFFVNWVKHSHFIVAASGLHGVIVCMTSSLYHLTLREMFFTCFRFEQQTRRGDCCRSHSSWTQFGVGGTSSKLLDSWRGSDDPIQTNWRRKEQTDNCMTERRDYMFSERTKQWCSHVKMATKALSLTVFVVWRIFFIRHRSLRVNENETLPCLNSAVVFPQFLAGYAQ